MHIVLSVSVMQVGVKLVQVSLTTQLESETKRIVATLMAHVAETPAPIDI